MKDNVHNVASNLWVGGLSPSGRAISLKFKMSARSIEVFELRSMGRAINQYVANIRKDLNTAVLLPSNATAP